MSHPSKCAAGGIASRVATLGIRNLISRVVATGKFTVRDCETARVVSVSPLRFAFPLTRFRSDRPVVAAVEP